MAQHKNVTRQAIRYTRADFTALRAWLQKVPAETILNLYYAVDDIAARGWGEPSGFVAFLEDMRDDLIARLTDANPLVAQSLSDARARHSWSKAAIDYLINAADKDNTRPSPDDPISLWFKPVISKKLKEEGILSLRDLVEWIRLRGRRWYRPIPYLGRGKAEVVHAWLLRHKNTLGEIPPFDSPEPVRLYPIALERGGKIAPLQNISVPSALDGSHGVNRHSLFPIIEARNDLEAIEAFVYKYRSNEKTYRAYQKEIERFLLWCIVERGIALSSAMVPDCEAYKDFLDAIPSSWIGIKKQRRSQGWRPFSGQLSQQSKRFAVHVVRVFFEWLVTVRYLSSNPWAAVSNPPVEQRIRPIHIEKALPETLWKKISDEGGILDQLSSLSDEELAERFRLRKRGKKLPLAAMFRTVRAAILVLGTTGIRREELAFATRDHLSEFADVPGLWRLDVLGKRSKWRTVFLPQRAVEAIRDHWKDRGDDFDFQLAQIPLISPVHFPPTRFAQQKSQEGSAGFSPDGLYRAITTWLKRIAVDPHADLDESERSALWNAGVHAFRHTFGTLTVARGAPLDVVQKVLGHASLNTTTIYVRSEEIRAAREMAKAAGVC